MTNRDEHEEFAAPVADREATPEEADAADRAAEAVDVQSVAEDYEHMTELGAHVQGEGQIEPDAD